MNLRFLSITAAALLLMVSAGANAQYQQDMKETDVGISGECYDASGTNGGGGHIGVKLDPSDPGSADANLLNEVENVGQTDSEAVSIVSGLALFGSQSATSGGLGTACDNTDCWDGECVDGSGNNVACDGACPSRSDHLGVHAYEFWVCYTGDKGVYLEGGEGTPLPPESTACYKGFTGSYQYNLANPN